MNNLAYGLKVLGMGMLIVLVTLYLLALILQLFQRFLSAKPHNETPVQPPKSPPVAVEAKPPADQAGNLEPIAASMGAILVALEGGKYRRFAVKEVRPLSTQRSNWALGGRS